MITEATIAKIEKRTAQHRKDAVKRLGQGVPFSYISMYLNGCDAIEEIYQELLRRQVMKGGETNMKSKSKGLTKNQKLKKLKTSKQKKLVKSKKK